MVPAAVHSRMPSPRYTYGVLQNLQNERGASCMHLASAGKRSDYERALIATRSAVNLATLLPGTAAEVNAVRRRCDEMLVSVKNELALGLGQLDASEGGQPTEAALAALERASRSAAEAFYRAFGEYNSVVKQALEECHASSSASTSPDWQAMRCFDLLKNCLGEMRAWLCGALALPRAGLEGLPARAATDLLFCLREQRARTEELRALAPPRMLELLGAAVEMDPELRSLLAKLEESLDVCTVRKAGLIPPRLWRLITSHIAKIEQLQVMLHNYASSPSAWSPPSRSPRSSSPPLSPTRQGFDGSWSHGLAVPRRRSPSHSTSKAPPPSTTVRAGAGQPQDGGASPDLASVALALLGGAGGPVEGMGSLRDTLRGISGEEIKQLLLVRLGGAEASAHDLFAAAPAPPFAPGQKAAAPEAAAGDAEGACRGSLSSSEPQVTRAALDDLVFRGRLGSGLGGSTYLAEWRGEVVAAKVASGREDACASWNVEVGMLAGLSQPGHPNVVRLLGAVEERLTRCVILEYCDGGDLQQALQRPTPRRFFFRVASGVAAGLTFLHANGVMHRDLKSPNVLLHGEHGVKIADFGLAASVQPTGLTRTHCLGREVLTPETGTYRWMAPEIVMHEAYSKSADVFSYAMILFELITHTVPFSDRSALQAAVSIGLQGKRPRLPAGTPTLLRDLVESCWAEDIASRPRALHLESQVALLESTLSPSDREWLECPLGNPVLKEEPPPPNDNSGAPLAVAERRRRRSHQLGCEIAAALGSASTEKILPRRRRTASTALILSEQAAKPPPRDRRPKLPCIDGGVTPPASTDAIPSPEELEGLTRELSRLREDALADAAGK